MQPSQVQVIKHWLPLSWGLLLIRPGFSSTAVFFSIIFPVRGQEISLAALTLSSAPQSSAKTHFPFLNCHQIQHIDYDY